MIFSENFEKYMNDALFVKNEQNMNLSKHSCVEIFGSLRSPQFFYLLKKPDSRDTPKLFRGAPLVFNQNITEYGFSIVKSSTHSQLI